VAAVRLESESCEPRGMKGLIRTDYDIISLFLAVGCMTRGPECRCFSLIFFLASIFLDLPCRSASFRHLPRAVLLP
jgi:hypothetical protein